MRWFNRFRKKNHKNVNLCIPGEAAPVFSTSPCTSEPKIWTVGGGKGGVGKSLIAANIGIILSKLGNKVLLIDADLGAANLHTLMGADGNETSLSSFLKGEVNDLRLLVSKTGIPGLDLISGAKDSLDVGGLDINMLKLSDALRKLEFDYVLVDLGPGTSSNMLDLFLMAEEGILVTTPEPTSIENTYRFIKCLCLRNIRNIVNSEEDGHLKEMLKKTFSKEQRKRVKTVADIVAQLRLMDTENAERLKDILGRTNVSLIINQTRRTEDNYIGPSMRRACSDCFSIDIRHLGDIRHDDCVGDSIRTRRPLVIHYNQSGAATAVESCLRKLLGSKKTELYRARV